jgi:4,5-DOPA dioxygenase extradiol
LGSGNIVHNLGLIDSDMDAASADWNTAFDLKVKEFIDKGRRPDLADYLKLPGGRLAVPTPDHYRPFLAALGAGGEAPASYPY